MPPSVNGFHPKNLWKDEGFFAKILYVNKFDLSKGWDVFTLLREFLPEKCLPIKSQPSEPQAQNMAEAFMHINWLNSPSKFALC